MNKEFVKIKKQNIPLRKNRISRFKRQIKAIENHLRNEMVNFAKN